MISAEPPEQFARPGKGRRRAVWTALVMTVLTAVLSATAFYMVCACFSSYDDMGYFMLTQKTFHAGRSLYDQTFTQYGPAYYAYEQFLHAITRWPVSHDSTLVFTAFAWVGISLLCAGYVARLAGNVFLTTWTFFAVFIMLGFLKNEAGHPQELCALLLGGMLLSSSFLARGRHTGIILGVIGCLVGLLSMTKPNLGVFAALAGAVSLSNLVAARRTRNVLFGASALAALILPIALMRHNLAPAGLYCFLESGAILLLVVELASSKPERSLSLSAFAAPVVGFAVALLAGTAYALATGTSAAGLLRGLVLQHLGFDQIFFLWPPFDLEDVLLSVGLAWLVWMATGPGRRFWQGSPWVPALLKLSVAPLMVVTALTVGLAVSPTFVWFLPLVVAAAQLLPRQPKSAWDVAPRHFAVSLAVLSGLWGYPVWGSQRGMSFFLLIPVALVWCADAVRYGFASAPADLAGGRRTTDRLLSSWRAAGTVLSYVAAVGVVGLGLARADQAAKAYHRLEPSGLRGSRFLHMPPEMADFYRRAVRAAQAHGRAFFTMPGLGSLYFWANQDPPTAINATTWMLLLTPDQQAQVVEELQKTPDLCVIRWPELVEFWTHGRDISQNKIVRYIEDNFVVAESFDGWEFMEKRTTDGPR
jgi:hypothetical protein